MVNLEWAARNPQSPHTKEELDAAREQQAVQQRHADALIQQRIPALRARAQEMMAIEETGPAFADLQNALTWLDAAQTPETRAAAVGQLSQAIERWQEGVAITARTKRLLAPAQAAEAQRRATEERSRPKALTIEERVKRIEQRLGLS
jgi:hypothetical protein